MSLRHIIALASLAAAGSAFAQTKWDLPAAYPANNFHTENLAQFAADVDKATAAGHARDQAGRVPQPFQHL